MKDRSENIDEEVSSGQSRTFSNCKNYFQKFLFENYLGDNSVVILVDPVITRFQLPCETIIAADIFTAFEHRLGTSIYVNVRPPTGELSG